MRLPEPIQQWVDQHRVLVICSPITDLGPLQSGLDRLGAEARVMRLGMADQANRELFHQLERATGLHTLPQVFIDGEFAGGIEQAAARLPAPRVRDVDAESALRAIGSVLGYAGMIPFAAAVLVIWGSDVGPWQRFALQGMVSYAAVILTFFGAVHWGIALLGRWDSSYWLLMGGMLPALLAWIALMLPWRLAVLVLLLAFSALYAYERLALWAHLPGWYLHLRSRLTLLSLLCMGVATVAPGARLL